MGLHDLGFKLTDADLSSIMAVIVSSVTAVAVWLLCRMAVVWAKDKDGGGEVSVKEFDRAMRAAEKLPSKKERQAMQEEKVAKKRGITEEDKEERGGGGHAGARVRRTLLRTVCVGQIFCLFKQLSQAGAVDSQVSSSIVFLGQARSAAGSDNNISLAEWNETGSIGILAVHSFNRGVIEISLGHGGALSGAMVRIPCYQRELQGIDYEPEDVTAAFRAFARNAPDGMIRLRHVHAILNMQDRQVRGLDCMKMWPWMRDLPTGVWAGRGWAFDENGLRRLSSTGGSGAMHGVELFESVGAAEAAASGENTKETVVAGSVSEPAAPPEGQKPNLFRKNNLVKQSGVSNILWNRSIIGWEVQIPRFDSKGKRIGKTNRVFAVKKFLVPGRSEAEADAEALEAAKAFRAELVQQGVLSEAKPRDPDFTSEVPGVMWKKEMQKWQVQIRHKNRKKSIFGGYFTEKAAAEAKALELREQHGLERQVKAVSTLAELPVFHPKVPYPAVKWNQGEQQWHARCQVGCAHRHFRIRPKDHSEEELERSFKVAVAWKKKQEKEKEKAVKPKAVKPKAPPVKKRRK
eukprot:Skav235814  [mRNA]  locus=scaffold1267:374362:386885:- [translate_table: standard]